MLCGVCVVRGLVLVSCEVGLCCVSVELLFVDMDAPPPTCYNTKALSSVHQQDTDGHSPPITELLVVDMDPLPHTC